MAKKLTLKPKAEKPKKERTDTDVMNEFFETHHYDEKPKVDWRTYFANEPDGEDD